MCEMQRSYWKGSPDNPARVQCADLNLLVPYDSPGGLRGGRRQSGAAMTNTITPGSYTSVSTYGPAAGSDSPVKASPSSLAAYGQGAGTPRPAAASVTVTLSEAAKAALAAEPDARPLAAVVTSVRSAIDALLKDAKAATALKDGRPTIDLSAIDRRSLWAIATNREGKFALEERVAATLQLNGKRDAALSGPAAAARVTGDYAGLYRSYLTTLDAAGPEEKATAQWTADRAAVIRGLDQATARPGAAPDVEGDPVAAWLKESGGVVASPRTRDIGKVAADVRAVLDRQYSDAAAQGRSDDKDGGAIDFSKFDGRSLAAVALNKSDAFSGHEIAMASAEVKARNRDKVTSHYEDASASGDPSAFGKSIITQYAVMSDEERQASGWTPALYDRVVALQDMSERIAAMFTSSGASGTAGRMSLLDYL